VTHVKISPSDTTGEYVGLSGGKFAFNTSGPDGVLKCQASQALNQGKVKEAKELWTEALRRQSNDAEVLIYQENQRILDQKLPYINVIAGVVTSNVLDILQGTYTAQKHYNQDHNNTIQLRIIIANFGSTKQNVGLVAQQIITAANNDEKIKAMVDLPALANTTSVLKTLAQGNFPIVLSTGSASALENGGNFFHVEATTTEQGAQAAQYVEKNCPNLSDEQHLHDCAGQAITVFIDVGDRYSSTLGQAFVTQLLNDKAAKKTGKTATVVYYSSTDSSTIVDKVQTFGDSPPDLIYFAGDAVNADILLQVLPQGEKYNNLRVLGGDALYQTGKYRAGDYRHLNFTAFAYPDEWNILKPGYTTPDFFCDYARNFAGGLVSAPTCSGWQTTAQGKIGYGYSRPENDVILSYDALNVVLAGNALATIDGIASRDQLLAGIRSIKGSQAFEGVSGQIAFGPDGNPINKAMLVLRVNEHGQTRQEQNYGAF
jgi:ABC-type branched-subunit amino acid transport system substrate-binding protein